MEQQIVKQFKNFGIKAESTAFVGDKISVKKVLNKEIMIERYEIQKSNFMDFKNDKRLCLQIVLGGEKRIIFIGSSYLMSMIQKVDKDDFPFKTIIVEIEERYEFS